jgi:hypothetical protein
MTATTLNPPLTHDVRPRAVRAAIVVLIATALLVSMFLVGRLTAPDHTVRTVVTVPTAVAEKIVTCRMGRLC